MTCRVVVLLSGRGSNLQALLAHIDRHVIDAEVVGVISNRPHAGGLAIAREAGITAACIDHRRYSNRAEGPSGNRAEGPSGNQAEGQGADRTSFEQVLGTTIDALAPDIVLLAGFMRILTPAFVRRYSPRLLNIHPSLLPDHRGLDTHARALARGDRIHGASVHVVTPELDAGPVIAQVVVPVLADDDPESLAARVQKGEHLLYPIVLAWYAEGRLDLGDGQIRLDAQALPETGLRFELDDLSTPMQATGGHAGRDQSPQSHSPRDHSEVP
ncbi:MAG: phosphoribosylglycinamide formyltransferase [Gammaproteobacteria bacterium]|nr:phosphoribosylglycinamide formyltransferase [Gammaproteobacteria bacterium]